MAAYQAFRLRSQPAPSPPVAANRAAANNRSGLAGRTEPTPSPRLEADSGEAQAPSKVFHWRSVETADYRGYVENLRAIGCPEQTVRDIVITDVNRLYASRRAAVLTQGKVPKFWQTVEPVAEEQSVERMQQLAALEREKIETEGESPAGVARPASGGPWKPALC